MSDQPQHSPQSISRTVVHFEEDIDPRVAELLDQYFENLQAGLEPDLESMLAANPDIADELRSCAESMQLVHGSTQPTSPHQLGDFRIIREVGRGGMGVVYEAQQQSLKRRVALKVLRYAVADADAMTRFRREAETVIRRNIQVQSHEQIAEALEKSVPAVRMIWVRALKRLKSEMRD